MRLSGPQSRDSNIDNTDSSDTEVEPRPQHDDEPPLTQYEIDRDGDFEHLANESEDDARATQKFIRRKDIIGDNIAAENGIIVSVECINFMCHERLVVHLGPLINFVIGENGSGKSAVLTAITLCLGGKASTTNRGGSLKSFIKGGQENARLTIKLKNEGEDAYQPDVYGNLIIVERNFSRSGSSGFKLKNERGAVISTKKGDVEEIIDYFQMQIDNPMNVLTQDAARQFLNQSTPHQKYKFFVKGVQLEQLDNDYRLLQETTDAMEAVLQDLAATVEVLERQMKKAQEKAAIVNEHEDMRAAARLYGKQSAWAQVEDEEASLRERQQRARDAGEAAEAKLAAAEEKGLYYEQVNQKHTLTEEAVIQVQEDLNPLREEEAQAKERFDVATQELHAIHQEQRQIRECLTTAKKWFRETQNKIRDEEHRIENANGGVHARKIIELAEAQEQVSRAKTKLGESEGEKPGLEDKRDAARAAFDAFKPSLDAKRQEIGACEDRIRAIRRDAGQHMSAFDAKIPSLLRMIRDDDGFREKPIGPVGLHIKLRKPVWSNALERSIGNLLGGFIVTCKPDQQRLSGMMRRIGLLGSPVLIGNSNKITSLHEPDECYDTVLRILDIDNELIKRQLIINQAIEQTILVKNKNDAERIMYDGPRPQNVKQCFALHPTKRGWGLRFGYMQGPQDPGRDAAVGPITPPYGKPRMKTDVDSQVAFLEDNLEHLRQELRILESRGRELEQILAKSVQAIKQHKTTHDKLRIILQRSEENVDRLQEELDKDNVEDNHLEGLRDNLKEAQLDVEMHSASYGDATIGKEKLNQTCSEMKARVNDVKAKIGEHDMKIKKAQDKATRARQARGIALQDKNLALQAVDEARIAQAAAEQKCNRQQLRVDDFIRQASQVCARVEIPEGDNAASIDKKLQALHDQLNTYNKRLGGSDADILSASERAIVKCQTARKQYKDLDEVRTLLKRSYLQRLEMWRSFQRHISARARINFTFLLTERGFRGRLKLDHKGKMLDLSIEPDETVKSMKGRQTKTLSGGEKSFSSVCLLLSLWEAMGAPLRCLDEFDVFMDQVNRDVSTKMIVCGV